MNNKFKIIHLFVDVSRKSPKSHKIVDFVDRNIKMINYNGIIIEMVPIISDKDKALLLENGIKGLPALLDRQAPGPVKGPDNIIAALNALSKSSRKPKKKSAEEMLREAQMADMDMDKFQAGEYDDEDDFDDDGIMRGDPDAVKQSIQRRMAEFNKRRTGRTEDEEPKKGGRRRKKSKKQQQQPDDDMYEDNIEPPRGGGAGRGGEGGGGGRGGRGGAGGTSTEVNFEDWDLETQQLLDKGGGGDW